MTWSRALSSTEIYYVMGYLNYACQQPSQFPPSVMCSFAWYTWTGSCPSPWKQPSNFASLQGNTTAACCTQTCANVAYYSTSTGVYNSGWNFNTNIGDPWGVKTGTVQWSQNYSGYMGSAKYFYCPSGFYWKNDATIVASFNSDPTQCNCCSEMCDHWQTRTSGCSSANGQLKSNGPSIIGNTFATCCDQLCSGYTGCPSNWILITSASTTVGSTTVTCCSQTCASWYSSGTTCSNSNYTYQQSTSQSRLASTSGFNAACCAANCGGVTCPAGYSNVGSGTLEPRLRRAA